MALQAPAEPEYDERRRPQDPRIDPREARYYQSQADERRRRGRDDYEG